MLLSDATPIDDLDTKIRWVVLSRACFAVILIISNLLFTLQQDLSFQTQPFAALYNVAGSILIFSIIYLIWLNQFKNFYFLAYFQLILDTFFVTIIIFITGGYNSIFTFLYLVVIIYSAMVLLHKGSLIVASVSCFLYAVIIELEYYKIITPFYNDTFLSDAVEVTHIIYRIIIMILACFAVAVLSGILALQLKGAKYDLKMVKQHLKRVEKMAAMDEMVAGIAHEVKNPLASLAGSIQLLQEDTKSGSYEDKLMQIILRETDRLKEIVNNIALFSKPKIDKATLTNVSETIEDVIQLFKKDPQWDKKIRFSQDLDSDIELFIDPDHLKQILWNLLSNAAQSIEDTGKIKIQLNASRNGKVYLIIKDTGSGIDEEKASQIFDPFFTTKPDGTGLGLSIIHRLIDTYEGIIDFESTPGKGTVFTIIF